MPIGVRKPKTSTRVQVENVADFTGGLNLMSDAFKLSANESPEMINVDIDRRGGFQLRRGVDRLPVNYRNFQGNLISQLPGTMVRSLGTYEVGTQGNEYLIVNDNTFISWVRRDGTQQQLLNGAASFSGPARSAVMRDACWIERYGDQNVVKLVENGTHSIVQPSGPTWQNDLKAPGGTEYFPRARCVATHRGYMWTANTTEASVRFPSRVRWSHPNLPSAWRENDYIDVAVGSDGDGITAIVPFLDRLLVFKHESVHAIYGYDPDTFEVVDLSTTVGAVSQEAVVVTPGGVFFFDALTGVQFYNGGEIRWLFEPIFPAIEDKRLNPQNAGVVTMGWVGQRLWVSVPWNSTERNRCLVFDPFISERGAWMVYDLALGPFTEVWDGIYVSSQAGSRRLHQLEQANPHDDFTGSQVPIGSMYRTRWHDLGEPAVRKRWKRMEAVLQGGSQSVLRVEVFVDYDQSAPVKQFWLSTDNAGGTLVWGSGAWDGASWATEGQFDVIDRGSSLGLARAVQLVFHGPTNAVPWGVDAFMLKYIPKRLR